MAAPYQDGAGWIDVLGPPEGAEIVVQSGTLALSTSLQDICSKVVTPVSDVRIVIMAKVSIRDEVNGYPTAYGQYVELVIEINGTEYEWAHVDFTVSTASNNPYQSQTTPALTYVFPASSGVAYTIKLRGKEVGTRDFLAQEGKMIIMFASEADL